MGSSLRSLRDLRMADCIKGTASHEYEGFGCTRQPQAQLERGSAWIRNDGEDRDHPDTKQAVACSAG